jgi:5-methylcytosine-specific restriction endonuclease McrA
MRTSKVSIISIQFKNIKDPCTALTARGVISSLKGANVSDFNTKNNETSDNRCGTYAGFRAHLNKNQESCVECKNARSAYKKQYDFKNSEKVKEYYKEYQTNNYEKMTKYSKEYYEKNKEKIKELQKQWRKNNPQYGPESVRRRRNKKTNNGYIPYKEFEVIDLYGTKCHICNFEIDLLCSRSAKKDNWEFGLHIDHLIPISKGGPDTLENVRPSHAICNLRKGAKND